MDGDPEADFPLEVGLSELRAQTLPCIFPRMSPESTELRGDPRGFSKGDFGRTLLGRAGSQSGSSVSHFHGIPEGFGWKGP